MDTQVEREILAAHADRLNAGLQGPAAYPPVCAYAESGEQAAESLAVNGDLRRQQTCQSGTRRQFRVEAVFHHTDTFALGLAHTPPRRYVAKAGAPRGGRQAAVGRRPPAEEKAAW